MSRDPSVGLVDLLVADLTPVKPVPPLWQSVAATLAAGAVVAGTVSLTLGLRSAVWQDLAQDSGFVGGVVGVVVIAVAGCVAGLASAGSHRGADVVGNDCARDAGRPPLLSGPGRSASVAGPLLDAAVDGSGRGRCARQLDAALGAVSANERLVENGLVPLACRVDRRRSFIG